LSYKLSSKNLTEKEYDDIQNASTLEDLETLKAFLLENISIENDENNKNLMSLISVRIMSNDEYEKNIKTGTLGGSITAANINVWHYDNSVGIGVMNKGYGFTSFQQDSFITIFITPTDKSGTWTYTFTAQGEHIQNNKSSNSSHRFFNDLTFKTQSAVGMYGGGAAYSAINTKNINSSFEDEKIKQQSSNSIESYISEGHWNTWNKVILYYNFTYNFRPVFQYVDSKKSKNIYE